MNNRANDNMCNEKVMQWLLEDKNPEVVLRVLKEYMELEDNNPEVVEAKNKLLASSIFGNAMDMLKSDKVWSQYDAITSFAEWGLTRKDLNIDNEVFTFIEKTKFKPMCGEALLLRNLVKLGFNDQIVLDEIEIALYKIKEDGGFGCFSKNKKINDPKVPHKSCARITTNYLLLIAEMKRNHMQVPCEKELVQYFLKRNVIYRTDDMKTILVEGMDSTYYPPEAINNGIQNILYALSVLGVAKNECCLDAWDCLYNHKGENGIYIITKTKTKPSFKIGTKGKPNKWVTLYALMAEKEVERN